MKIVRFFLMVFSLGVLLITTYTSYIFSSSNSGLDWEKLELIITEVEQSSPLDERVIDMYAQIHKGALERSSLEKIIDALSGDMNTNCPCFDVARVTYINNYHKLGENDFAVARRIERKVSQRQCLTYVLNASNYLYGNKGVRSAAAFFFGKTMKELSDDELIGLLIMLENSSLYNPKRFRKKYDAKVREVKEQMR